MKLAFRRILSCTLLWACLIPFHQVSAAPRKEKKIKAAKITGRIHLYGNRYILKEAKGKKWFVILENKTLEKLLSVLRDIELYSVEGGVHSFQKNQYLFIKDFAETKGKKKKTEALLEAELEDEKPSLSIKRKTKKRRKSRKVSRRSKKKTRKSTRRYTKRRKNSKRRYSKKRKNSKRRYTKAKKRKSSKRKYRTSRSKNSKKRYTKVKSRSSKRRKYSKKRKNSRRRKRSRRDTDDS